MDDKMQKAMQILQMKALAIVITLSLMVLGVHCSSLNHPTTLTQSVEGTHRMGPNKIWLSHEHILVDFIGADHIQSSDWNHDTVITTVLPYLNELHKHGVDFFVDATPNYLGRDVLLLEKLAQRSGIEIITNTGLYGARNNQFIPMYAKGISAEHLAEMWIHEFENGIEGTSIKPGFIKIGIDNSDTLSDLHQKLVRAAALTHLGTGLVIASHTGKGAGMWPQLDILKSMGVSPQAFIWVHAQNETDNKSYLAAARMGCWISLDGVGGSLNKHIDKILYAKTNGFLDKVLISHDAGWYDPQKEKQAIKPYTAIFEHLYPALKNRGFSEDDFNLLISINPSQAFSIKIRRLADTG